MSSEENQQAVPDPEADQSAPIPFGHKNPADNKHHGAQAPDFDGEKTVPSELAEPAPAPSPDEGGDMSAPIPFGHENPDDNKRD